MDTKFKKGDARLIGNRYAKGNKPNKTSFKKGEHRSLSTEFKKGTHSLTEWKKGHIPWCIGIKRPDISLRQRGSNNPMWGKTHTEEWKQNHSKLVSGENHPNWLGGKSFEPYTIDWTKTLKRSIRERDQYTCKICGKLQNKELFCVHHIDYDKNNCNPNNLITLCRSCHGKTQKNRNYWRDYFKKI